MSERPILFSGEMVRAILEGRKTQTRRVVKPQPEYEGEKSYGDSWAWRNGKDWFSGVTTEQLAGKHGLCYPGRSYGQPGDRLWVRETLCQHSCFGFPLGQQSQHDALGNRVWSYAADQSDLDSVTRKRPGIHMPRWASRLTLEVTKVRVERVQQIGTEDIKAEGVNFVSNQYPLLVEFRQLWDKINGSRGFGWDANPWVWVIEFRNLAAAGGNQQEPQK